jgi:hypothetical protein
MTRLLRTIRLDPSDGVVFPLAAEPGEWAVPGGFCFWDDDVAALDGKRRQAFRAGFLGLTSFGWSTLVEVVEATAAQREAAVCALASHIRSDHGAPDDPAARAAAEEEIGFAESLCDHPPGSLVALTRSADGGDVRERFRTLHQRPLEHRAFETLPVFAAVSVEGEDEAPILPDLARMARGAEGRLAPAAGAPNPMRQPDMRAPDRPRAASTAAPDRLRRTEGST